MLGCLLSLFWFYAPFSLKKLSCLSSRSVSWAGEGLWMDPSAKINSNNATQALSQKGSLFGVVIINFEWLTRFSGFVFDSDWLSTAFLFWAPSDCVQPCNDKRSNTRQGEIIGYKVLRCKNSATWVQRLVFGTLRLFQKQHFWIFSLDDHHGADNFYRVAVFFNPVESLRCLWKLFWPNVIKYDCFELFATMFRICKKQKIQGITI